MKSLPYKKFKPIKLLVFKRLAVFIFISLSTTVKADYLVDLQQHAQHLKLAKKTQWKTLLHFSPQLLNFQTRSLITYPRFFFHPQGHRFAELELQATLKAFFSSKEQDDNSAQCRFPARFLWLKQQLEIDTSLLPNRNCQKLKHWLNGLDVSGISLVFPVAYLNNPPSMFGHSFLRLDKPQKDSQLLAKTINFAAVTEKERGLKFAFKGLFGGYSGQFTLAPYYELLKQYGDLESRDVWEYQLNFSALEIERLLLHLWELLPAKFDYYFINKNCSFQLLALLEAARPNLNLTEQFFLDAIPADTVRAITQKPALLKKRQYRPALATLLNEKAQFLTTEQQQLATDIATENLAVSSLATMQFKEKHQAQILELAFDYLSYLNANKIKYEQAINGELAYEILTARSLLPALEKIPLKPPDFSPDQGHAGNRVQLAYGYDGLEDYLELEFRWSYHDLYDSSAGFVNGAQVEFLKPSLRYYPHKNKLSLEAIELLNIHSMPKANSFMSPFSWQVAIGSKRQRFDSGTREFVGGIKLGGGLSYAIKTGSLLSLSGLGNLVLGETFHQYIALGLGAGLHLQHDITPQWRVGIEMEWMQYLQGIKHTQSSYHLKQRFTLNTHHALVLDVAYATEFSKAELIGQFAWRLYF